MDKNKNMEHAHTEELQKYWQEQEPIWRKIRELGWQKYLASLDLANGFALRDRKLRCIDEGTTGGIHLAGSGILNKSEAVAIVRQAQVTGIYSHAGCGAAALYAKENGLDMSRADEYGIAWAKDLAQAAGLPYAGHIELAELARPADFHIARVTYYDATGRFDPARVEGLPPGFVISRKYLLPDYAKQEAGITVGIALGNHGFGKLITPAEPFNFVVIGDKSCGFNIELLQNELAEIAHEHHGVVRVEGFMVP